MPVIGFLRSTSLAVSTPMVTGFRQGPTAAGFIEGQNVKAVAIVSAARLKARQEADRYEVVINSGGPRRKPVALVRAE